MKRNHTRYLEMASAYVDDILPSPKKESFERHCKQCEECRAILSELRNVRLLVSGHGDVTVPPFFMTRLHARLKEQTTVIDPWIYEAKKLLPVFSLLAIILSLFILFRSDEQAGSPDDYYLSPRTPLEHRVLTQKKAYTTEEVFVLAVMQERRGE